MASGRHAAELAGSNAGEPFLVVGVIESWGADPHTDVGGTVRVRVEVRMPPWALRMTSDSPSVTL